MKRVIFFLIVAVLSMGLEGCKRGPSSSVNQKKKIKRGKPIPCPIKDC